MSTKQKPPRKPRNLKAVVAWLNHYGLNVYGPAADLKKGHEYPSCQDYTAKDIERYVRLKEAGLLLRMDHWEEEEPTPATSQTAKVR